MLPSSATIRAVMPVSSATSRRATSAVASPGHGVPFGSTQKLSQARPTSTTSATAGTPGEESRRNTTPPAEKARTIRGLDMSPHAGLRQPPSPSVARHNSRWRAFLYAQEDAPEVHEKAGYLDGHDAALVAIHAQNLE